MSETKTRHAITEYLWVGAGWGEAIFKLQNGKRYYFMIFFDSGSFFIYELGETDTEPTPNNQVFNPAFFDVDSAIEFLSTLFTDQECDDIFEILGDFTDAYKSDKIPLFGEYFDKDHKNIRISTDQIFTQMVRSEENKN